MQSQRHQNRVNKLRLQSYRSKLTPIQRRRADMAEKVQRYAQSADLSMAQAREAVRLACCLLALGFADDAAFKHAALAADIMVRVNNASHLPQRRFNTLH